MKIVLLYVAGKVEPYAGQAEDLYGEKIRHLFPFEIRTIRAKSSQREAASFKRDTESKALLDQLESTDEVWLLDEQGWAAKDSHDFSGYVVRAIESGKRRLVLVVGGPFGTSEVLKKRAHKVVSLSGLTMNHHLAKVVLLEQIYRALTIWRGIPYHN